MEVRGDNKFDIDLRTGQATDVYQPPPPLTEQEPGSACNNHLSSSPQNPFIGPSEESWQTQPSPNVESHNPFKEIKKGKQGGDDTIPLEPLNQEQIFASINVTSNASQDLGSTSRIVGESSNDQHSSVAEPSTPTSSNENIEHQKIKGPEIQNPPIQVMERPNENGTNGQYVFPSHVFARNNTNAPVEWSTASNESLFSIYMGNTSFSSELACFKSSDLDKPGDVCMSDQHIASPNHQPPIPENKFNAISKGTAQLHEEGLKVTEAKAAETMREVIMESSQTTKNVVIKEDKKSNSRRQSDGSTGSYAFKTSKDGDKNVSSKGVGENNTPNMKSEQNEKTKEADRTQKSNTDAPPNRWLSCFSCCTFC